MTFLNESTWRGQIYQGGWTQGANGDVAVIEPATGQEIGRIGCAGPSDVAASAARAAAAQPAWAATPHTVRSAILRKAADLWLENAAEIEDWVVRESGKIPPAAQFETHNSTGEIYEAATLPSRPYGELLPSEQPRLSYAERRPVGVVGVIAPFNFPQILSVRSVAPALALGNAVILKPDLRTSICGGVVVARIFEEAGLPEGLLHVLPGAAEAGSALTEDPDVAMIAFTGSTAVGRQVGAAAGRTLKRCSLELGGNNALIVLDDADLDVASSAGAWGAFLHQGQVCMTAGRHIVMEAVAQEYLDRLAQRAANLPVGDPHLEQVAIGPLINESQLANVDRIVTATVDAGAQVRAGATHEKLFYAPTVLAGVTTEMAAFREEIFGPVAPVTIVRDEAEAVAVANDTEYGLVAAIQTGSRDRGRALADQLRTGIVHVNDQTLNNDAYAPFGGTGASGNGSRFGSQSSWDEFTQWQWLTVRDQAHGFPF